MNGTKDELTERNISFYPSVGRKKYDLWKDLPEEERAGTRPPFRRISSCTMNLAEVADYITSPMTKTEKGEKTLEALTAEIRNSGADYKAKKTYLLPNVVFGGVPVVKWEEKTDQTTGQPRQVQTQRKKANFTDEAVFSGLVILDLDHLSENGVNLRQLREKVSGDGELGLRLLFVSPSGDGLKIVCKSKRGFNSPQTYEREYSALANYLTTLLGKMYTPEIASAVVDTSGKDISRTCFLCHDPEARLFEPTSFFDSEKHPAPKKETSPRKYDYPQQARGDDDGIEELVRRVEESGKDIAPTYKEYFPLVCSFSSLGERGREYLHRVCRFSPKYDRDDTDYDFDNNVPDETQHIGYFVNLCRSNGIDTGLKEYLKEQNKTDFRPMNGKDAQFTASTEKASPEARKALKYEDRYKPYEKGELWAELAKEPGGTKTKYEFTGADNTKEHLRIPTEGITMIGGLSSHGKSTFLRNLALEFAENEDEGDTLFFTYEESKRKTYLRLLNTFIGTELNSGAKERNQDCIREYAKDGTTAYISADKVKIFKERVSSFENLLEGSKLRIYAVNDTSSELVDFLREYGTRRRIKAVFVDFIQRLSHGGKVGDRKEDLRLVAEDLQNYTKEAQVPVIVAVQLNRATPSPTRMGANNLAESADLTRYAETIVCLWNSSKSEDISDDKFIGSGEEKKLKERGFISGTSGKLYARITKNKEGESGIDAVLGFNGKTEKIEPEGTDLPGTPAPKRGRNGAEITDMEDY